MWRLRGDALPMLEAAGLGDVLAPYPGLVSIGTNDNGRILVDLEAAHGLIAIRGPEDTRRAALSAIALELATNRWSDHMRITLVGFDAELGEASPRSPRTASGPPRRSGTRCPSWRDAARRCGRRSPRPASTPCSPDAAAACSARRGCRTT